MHRDAFQFVAYAVETYGPFPMVVEFGGRTVNGMVRPLFTTDKRAKGAEYMSIDLHEGPNVDRVEDAAKWDGRGIWSCVVCCEVFEHSRSKWALVNSAYRALVPGGVFIVTCAGPDRAPHSGIDGGPVHEGEHYANLHPPALWDILTPVFDVAEFHYHRDRGDLYAVATKGERHG